MRALLAFAIVALLPDGAAADLVSITATGRWDNSAATTPESAPGAAWSFSFEAVSPLAADHSASVSDFAFTLGGSPAGGPATFVEFFAGPSSGLFDVALADGDVLELFGARAFGADLALIPGVYTATIEVIDPGSGLTGTGSGRVMIAAVDPPAVPEPSSLIGLATGAIALAGFRLARPLRRPEFP